MSQVAIDRSTMLDAHGRPWALETRLAAIVAMLIPKGIPCTRPCLHAMAWWEESISPFLGCDVPSSDWRRTADGPRSTAVDVVIDDWLAKGVAREWNERPLLSGDMEVDADLVVRGEAVAGRGHEMFRKPPALFRPWFRTMVGFLDGWSVFGETNPKFDGGSRDIRLMALSDPTYADASEWTTLGGPGAVRLTSSTIPGFVGNGLGFLMRKWSTPMDDGSVYAKDDYQAAWLLGRWLVNRAAAHPSFGGRAFLAVRDRLRFVERIDVDGVVHAQFLENDACVATASWRPGRRVHAFELPKGGTLRQEMDDGELLSLEVAAERRLEGIGTYVMRHAQSRGCRRAPSPPEGGETVWGRAGRPSPDGSGWILEWSSWPLCASASSAHPDP